MHRDGVPPPRSLRYTAPVCSPRSPRSFLVVALAASPACLGAGPYTAQGEPTDTSGPNDTSGPSGTTAIDDATTASPTSGVTTGSTAAPPTCGDGNVDPDEACDDGNRIDGDGCEGDCTPTPPPPNCGDGNVDPGEQCDDGNKVDGDGCQANCIVTPPPPNCGNGSVEPGEQCDDGNDVSTDACLGNCTAAKCGDGVVWNTVEECDDGNSLDTDACLKSCESAYCGDGAVQDGVEECDDGPANDDAAYDGCTTQCTPGPRCGDGVVQASGGEECDDGTPDGDDLCNACLKTPRRYLFVTSATYTGKFGGVIAADGLCTSIAGQNGIGTPNATWIAWLSDNGNSAYNRYLSKSFTGWYVLPGDPPKLVAKGWAGLTSGALLQPIHRTELGTTLPPGETVWSTTKVDGNVNDGSNHCTGWNSNWIIYKGRLGDANATNSDWTDKAPSATATCDAKRHLYCVEN